MVAAIQEVTETPCNKGKNPAEQKISEASDECTAYEKEVTILQKEIEEEAKALCADKAAES